MARTVDPPRRALLLYDGECAACLATIATLRRVLPYVPPAHAASEGELAAYGLTPRDLARSTWLVTPTRQYAGHQWLAALLRAQPTAGWRFLGHLMETPPWSWIAGLGALLVAAVRAPSDPSPTVASGDTTG